MNDILKKTFWKKQSIYIAMYALVLVLFCFNSYISLGLSRFVFNHFEIASNEGNLLVHFLSVGEADCTLISFPNGKTAVIDTGEDNTANEIVYYLKHNVLKNNTLDYLILTHSDADHVGGAIAILNAFEVKTVFRPKIASSIESNEEGYLVSTTLMYKNVINAIYEENCEVKYIENEYRFYEGNCLLTFFGPLKNYEETNNMCPIIKLEYKDKSFLFAGDVLKRAEEDLLSIYKNDLKVDVLKVAHHGSKNSNSEEFINNVESKYAVISVGSNNHGLPSQSVVDNLNYNNNMVLITEQKGNILFCVDDGSKLEFLYGEYSVVPFEYNFIYFSSAILIIVLCYNGIFLIKFSKCVKNIPSNLLDI